MTLPLADSREHSIEAIWPNIREMNALNVADITHANDRTFADVIRFAEKPLIDSHTNCRALADYDRCCTDDQLRALAKQDGLIGVHFGFIEKMDRVEDQKYNKMMRGFSRKMNELARKYKEPYEFLEHRMDPFEWPICLGGAVDDGTPSHRAKMSRLGDHIEHMVKVAGIDHVYRQRLLQRRNAGRASRPPKRW